jgi:hypothetical protein
MNGRNICGRAICGCAIAIVAMNANNTEIKILLFILLVNFDFLLQMYEK